MKITEMTRKDFEALPYRDSWNSTIKDIDSIVILPLRRKHDSGYQCMDFIACKEEEAICRLAGGSDVLHIEGIGGFGHNWFKKYGKCPETTPSTSWNIDCLPKSRLLRIFNTDRKVIVGSALSSFEIFSGERRL